MAGEYKATCGCAIHVAQWTTKRKVVTVKSCALHKAAPELLEACKQVMASLSVASLSDWEDSDNILTETGILARAIEKAEGK